MNFLHVRPDVISMKCISHSQTGKIQPLLVCLKQADQAQQLTNAVKCLWHSSNPGRTRQGLHWPQSDKGGSRGSFKELFRCGCYCARHSSDVNVSQTMTITAVKTKKPSADFGSLETSRVLRPNSLDTVSAQQLNPLTAVFNSSMTLQSCHQINCLCSQPRMSCQQNVPSNFPPLRYSMLSVLIINYQNFISCYKLDLIRITET